jgi:hypothetical protein
MEGNFIEHGSVGVLIKASGPAIRNANLIRYNTTGVKCDDGAEGVAVAYTTITDNQAGVIALDESDPDLGRGLWGSTGNNKIYGNSGYHVSNLSPGLTIFAQNNYWGVTQPPCLPKASKFSGSCSSWSETR